MISILMHSISSYEPPEKPRISWKPWAGGDTLVENPWENHQWLMLFPLNPPFSSRIFWFSIAFEATCQRQGWLWMALEDCLPGLCKWPSWSASHGPSQKKHWSPPEVQRKITTTLLGNINWITIPWYWFLSQQPSEFKGAKRAYIYYIYM